MAILDCHSTIFLFHEPFRMFANSNFLTLLSFFSASICIELIAWGQKSSYQCTIPFTSQIRWHLSYQRIVDYASSTLNELIGAHLHHHIFKKSMKITDETYQILDAPYKLGKWGRIGQWWEYWIGKSNILDGFLTYISAHVLYSLSMVWNLHGREGLSGKRQKSSYADAPMLTLKFQAV